MCGIAGLVNGEGHSFRDAEAVFEQLMWMTTLRGFHSTGVLAVKDKQLVSHKKALMLPDFLGTSGYIRGIKPLTHSAEVLIGHCRAATRGDVRDMHAHPFNVDHITAVHNGIIENHHQLSPQGQSVAVDSMVVPFQLATKGEREGLETLRGAYALAWYNSKDNTVNLARNDGRPLYAALLDKSKVVVFASEAEMIHAVLVRCNVSGYNGTIKRIPAGVHVKIDPKDPAGFLKLPFVVAGKSNTSVLGLNNSGSRKWPAAGADTGTNASSPLSNANTGPSTSTASSTERKINPKFGELWREHRRTVAGSVEQDLIKLDILTDEFNTQSKRLHNLPTSVKKLKRLASNIREYGYHLAEAVSFYVEGWTPYPNQRDRGVLTGHRRGYPDVLVHIPEVTEAQFKNAKFCPQLVAHIINFKAPSHKNGKLTLVCTLNSFAREVLDKGEVSKPQEPKEVVTLYPVGRNKNMVESGIFLNMTRNGCGECSGDIKLEMAGELLWTHDNVLCPTCANDPRVISRLGLEKKAAV